MIYQRDTVPSAVQPYNAASEDDLQRGVPGTDTLTDADASHTSTERAAASIWQAVQLFEPPPFSRRYRLTKRGVDILVSAIGLVVLAPLFGLIAVLIRLDSAGPMFFVQERVGYRGRIFRMCKFRSMASDSPVRPNGASDKDPHDQRITRVGRYLRRTSLDELPQLINVLRGDMSLVGPRPELVEIVLTRYEPWQYQRLLVPQGVTGWWQVTGRGNKLLWQHTEDDLDYIQRASLAFDLKILWLTVAAVIRGEGAF